MKKFEVGQKVIMRRDSYRYSGYSELNDTIGTIVEIDDYYLREVTEEILEDNGNDDSEFKMYDGWLYPKSCNFIKVRWYFMHKEMKRVLGNDSWYNFTDLMTYTDYLNSFKKSHPTVRKLIEITK